MRFINGFVVSLVSILFGGVLWASTPAIAQNVNELCGGSKLSLAGSDDCTTCVRDSAGNTASGNCGPENKFNSLIATIVNILSVIVGIVAVIMTIVGGFKLITSGGDSGQVASARNTVIYAIVGLIIVALAQFIVRFVLDKAN